MIDKADLGLQAEMIDADVTHSQGAVPTPGLKDPHPIQRALGDHAQEIGDHPTGRENPHLAPQRSRSKLRSQDWSRYSHHLGSHSPSRRQSSQHHQQSHSPECKHRKCSHSPDSRRGH